MAIIQSEIRIEKEDLRIRIPSDLKQEIEQYCEWASIKDVGHFFAEAAAFVFKKDRDWQTQQKEAKSI